MSIQNATAEFIPEIPWAKSPARFSANRKALVNRLKTVCAAIPKGTRRWAGQPKAILQNVRLSVNGTVELAGTDQERAITTVDDFERQGDRTVLVPAQQFLGALKSLKSVDVSCEIGRDDMTVTGGSASLTIRLDDQVNDFPMIGHADGGIEIMLESAALAAGLQASMFCTCSESRRYALGGVALHVEFPHEDVVSPAPCDGKLTLVATDTRRLSMHPVGAVGIASYGEMQPDPQQAKDGLTIVVPHASLAALVPFLKSGGSVVTLRINANYAEFSGYDWRVLTRLVEGRFPRYQDVIPADCNRQIGFHRADLLAGLESAMVACTEESRGIDVKFGNKPGETIVTIRGKSYDRGVSAVAVKAGQVIYRNRNRETEDGKEPDPRQDLTTYDPHYLVDYLRALPKSCEYVQLAILDCNSAGVMTAQDQPGLYLLMPLSRDR